MEGPAKSRLRIGDWSFDPASATIARDGATIRLDVKSMRLLMCLADRAGQVVSIDDLISNVWAGVAVSPDSLYQAVTSLRRQLGDDSREPAYIETVPRLGYRLIATTRPWEETTSHDAGNAGAAKSTGRIGKLIWVAIAIAVSVGAGFLLHARLSASNHPASASVAPPAASVAVLSFLDLTQGMHNEEFADGMTEELIDKISKIPGLNVPSATASFYYKGKSIPANEIAKALNATYLLDGSVRKSGGTVRIATRLMRADNSYVIWSRTYDRPVSDLIMVQDDIASEVAKALPSAIAPSGPLKQSH